ncbi:hypothetical protein Slin14017_G122280 [Septoria linicola]|nr:hypothetical protein Slin14017_G122280 [Septoria linicola]
MFQALATFMDSGQAASRRVASIDRPCSTDSRSHQLVEDLSASILVIEQPVATEQASTEDDLEAELKT